MSDVESAMELDHFMQKETTRKKLKNWAFGVVSVTILIICPIILYVLYMEGLDERLTLFWAVIMFGIDILMIVFTVWSARNKKKEMKITLQEIGHIGPDIPDVIEQTKKDYNSFWEQWDFYDSERGPVVRKDVNSPREVQGPDNSR